jgi:hypothetical protein
MFFRGALDIRENDTTSTISIAFVMASTADQWSTLVAN